MKREREVLKQKLREAEDDALKREGEASIIRKNMEKV